MHTYKVSVDFVFPKGIQCTNTYQYVLSDNNINDSQNNYAGWKKAEKKGCILPGSVHIKPWKCELLCSDIKLLIGCLGRWGGERGKKYKVARGTFGE